MSLHERSGEVGLEIGQIVEVGLASPDRASLHAHVLDVLGCAVGFDKGSLSFCDRSRSRTCARGYDRMAAFEELDRYMNELEHQEIAAALDGKWIVDLDVLSTRRRDRLSLYHQFLRPEKVSVFATAMWRGERGVQGITLARTGPGACFAAGELRALDGLLPAIQLADAYISARERDAFDGSLDAWAEATALTAKEREVAVLVVRGLSNSEIAAILGSSPNTIRNQLASVFRKATVSTRAEMVFVATTFSGCSGDHTVDRPRWRTRLERDQPTTRSRSIRNGRSTTVPRTQ